MNMNMVRVMVSIRVSIRVEVADCCIQTTNGDPPRGSAPLRILLCPLKKLPAIDQLLVLLLLLRVGQFMFFSCRRRRAKQRKVDTDPALSTASSYCHLAPASGNSYDDLVDDVTILGDAENSSGCYFQFQTSSGHRKVSHRL